MSLAHRGILRGQDSRIGRSSATTVLSSALTALLVDIRIALVRAGVVKGVPSVALAIGLCPIICSVTCILRAYLCLSGSAIRRLLPFRLDLLVALLCCTVLHWRSLESIAGRIGGVVVLSCVWIVVRVVQDDVRRQALDDPLVLQAFVRRQPLLWVPLETATDEIDERLIGHVSELVHDVAQPLLLLIVREHLEWSRHRVVLELGEQLLPLRVFEHLLRRHTDHIDDQLQLFLLVRPWEKREASVQFNHDAPEAPHVNLLSIRKETENDVRCPVESTLDVSVHDLVLEAATAKIGDHDAAFVFPLQENVLWLEIAVDDAQILHVAQC